MTELVDAGLVKRCGSFEIGNAMITLPKLRIVDVKPLWKDISLELSRLKAK